MADMDAIYKDRLHSKADYLMQLSDPGLANEFIVNGAQCEYLKEFTDKMVEYDDGVCVWTITTMLQAALDNSNVVWDQPRCLVPLIRYYESIIDTPAIGKVFDTEIKTSEGSHTDNIVSTFRWLNPSKFIQSAIKFNIDNDVLLSSFFNLIKLGIGKNDVENSGLYDHELDILMEVLKNDESPAHRIEKMFHTGDMSNLGIRRISFDLWGFSDKVPDNAQTQGEPLIIGGNTYNRSIVELLFWYYKNIQWVKFRETGVAKMFEQCEIDNVGRIMETLYGTAYDESVIADKAILAVHQIPRTHSSGDIRTLIINIGRFIEAYANVYFPHMKFKDPEFMSKVQQFASAVIEQKSSNAQDKYDDIEGTMEGALLELDELMKDDYIESTAKVVPIYNPFGIMTIVPATESTSKNKALESEPETRTVSQQKSIDKRIEKDNKREGRAHQMAANARANIRKGYNDYKRYTAKAKEIDTQVGKIYKNLYTKITNKNNEKYREEVLGGREPSPLRVLTKVIAYSGVFSVNPVLGILALITRHYNGKKTRAKERRKAMVELQNEMKIMDEKIADAQAAGDRKAKYELMRVRNAMDSTYDSIKSNMSKAPDKDLLTTKKSLINVEVNAGGNK